jgi:Bacterial EndoU nuclease
MAQDGPYDGENRDARPERHLQAGRLDAHAAGSRAELAEPRTRTEYYEALHAPDQVTQANDDVQETAAARSSWDAMAVEDRPPRDGFRVSAERTTHILDGEPEGGGGHRSGTGKPGKTEFPASWNDGKIMRHVLDVAQHPDSAPVDQHWNNRWLCSGTRERVEVSVVVLRSGEVWTAWPEEGGPGVVRNPRKETS